MTSGVPAYERSIRTGGLMRCCLETIRTTADLSQVGDKLTCKWCRSEEIEVGEDGAWRWSALPHIPGFPVGEPK